MPTTPTSTSDVFIHRHCMQKLLHEAITHEHNPCFGLLTGSGNIVSNCLPVTNKLALADSLSAKNSPNNSLFGAYLATDSNGDINLETLAKLNAIKSPRQVKTPFYYLILYLDHKGRIDARMYNDEQLKTAVTLNMLEDGEQAPTG